MKFEKKQVIYLIIAFIACYAIQANWQAGTDIIDSVYKTSLPFLYGAALAYIVNIVMGAYENLLSHFFKPEHHFQLKRGISMVLAYLTFFALFFGSFRLLFQI